MAKMHTFKGRLYTEIPKEAVELMKLSDKDEIIFTKLDEVSYSISKQPNLEDIVIEKVNSMLHRERDTATFLEMLDENEKKAYNTLMEKKILFEYTSKGKKMTGIDKTYAKPIKKKNSLGDFKIIDNEDELKNINSEIMKNGLQEEFLGVRGFDKKYYLIKREKLAELEKKILPSIVKEKKIKDICSESGCSEDLCNTALQFLREDGKVIERRGGVFQAI